MKKGSIPSMQSLRQPFRGQDPLSSPLSPPCLRSSRLRSRFSGDLWHTLSLGAQRSGRCSRLSSCPHSIPSGSRFGQPKTASAITSPSCTALVPEIGRGKYSRWSRHRSQDAQLKNFTFPPIGRDTRSPKKKGAILLCREESCSCENTAKVTGRAKFAFRLLGRVRSLCPTAKTACMKLRWASRTDPKVRTPEFYSGGRAFDPRQLHQ